MRTWKSAACGLIALGLVALAGGCTATATILVYGQPVRIVTPAHEHKAGCGHEYVWYDGHATYFVDGTWVFYAKGPDKWVVYEKPSPYLLRESDRIKVGAARSKAVPMTKKDDFAATKAPPAPAPSATKAPPK